MNKCRATILRTALAGATLFCAQSLHASETDIITVADAALAASFYADSSCLLTIDSLAQAGKTVIDADVDDKGSRMLIHCDTDAGRRLTLLARGDSLNISQRVPLLSREQISEGSFGMIAWLTRSGVNYADDSAPRRYVIAGSVMLTRSPPVDVAGYALHTERKAFGRLSGVLEPIVKSDVQPVSEPAETIDQEDKPSEAPSDPATAISDQDMSKASPSSADSGLQAE